METQAKSEPQELLSCREAAALAHVSRVHVWRLVQRGEVEAIRVGENGPIRIKAEPFRRMLEGSK
jgi:excisionase family DNA binding protein